MKPNGTLILGAGVSGMSCLRHLHGKRDLVVCDTRFDTDQSPIPNSRTFYQNFPQASLIKLSDFDRAIDSVSTMIVSPGLPLDHCLVRKALAAGIELCSDMDLFMDAVEGPVIGITGTNGKSTVTSLVGAMLEDNAFGVGGNLGPPALDLLNDEIAGYVLELSSFQLERMEARHFDVASITNISDDHLDRHESLDSYAAVKQRIYRDCRVAVYNGEDSRSRPLDDLPSIAINKDEQWRVIEKGVVIDGRFVANDTIKLTGDHNRFNVVAAAAIAHSSGASFDNIRRALETFEGLPHRVQIIGSIDDVTYVDDSKATNLGSCIAAIEGLITQPSSRKIVLIAGGMGKGADFAALGRAIPGHVRTVVLIGRDARLIAANIPDTPVVFASDLDDAVVKARMDALPGDVVLFSPACASFDMFENFVVRGQAFTRIVQGMSK